MVMYFGSACHISSSHNCFFFFFQAEDGIRDLTVTGVQTCALPICVGVGGKGTGASGEFACSAGWPCFQTGGACWAGAGFAHARTTPRANANDVRVIRRIVSLLEDEVGNGPASGGLDWRLGRYGPRIRFVKPAIRGVASSRNEAISLTMIRSFVLVVLGLAGLASAAAAADVILLAPMEIRASPQPLVPPAYRKTPLPAYPAAARAERL